MNKFIALGLSFIVFGSFPTLAQDSIAIQDTVKTKELPLKPERNISFTTNEGTWISLDVSPDGKQIVFDMMGDIYSIPISGGKAKKLTKGMAYEVHPKFSPDGKSLVFISDKTGSDNIWTMDLASEEMKQVTEDSNQNFFSADWSPDGDYIVGAKGRRNIKLYLYHKDGGSGVQLIKEPATLKTIDPAFSHDGKTIYYSRRTGGWNYNAQFPQYQIGSYDMEDATNAVVTSRYGSAFTPVLSPDGKWMVYGSRFETETGLVARNLQTGDESWLAYPVQRDDQESIASLGVLPAMSFTPDSKSLIASYGGKIYSISMEGKNATEIPFEVDLKIDLGPMVSFKYPIDDNAEAQVTQIRDGVPSPDGKQLAFTALNRLYVMDFPNGKARRLTNHNFTEAHPSWSPDGKQIVFTTWETEEGHLYKVGVNGRNLTRLTKTPGIYSNPAWSYRSDRIAFTKGTAENYRSSNSGFDARAREDLAWIPSNGGDITLIAKAKGRLHPHFTTVDDRVYVNKEDQLISIRWDGTDEKTHLKVKGITPYGSADALHEHVLSEYEDYSEPQDQASKPSEIKISPDGKRAFAKINNDIYTVLIPRFGTTAEISVANVEKASFPAKQLTEIGGEFPAWSSGSNKVHWSLGSSHFIYDLERAKVFEDSLQVVKKAEEKLKEERKKQGLPTNEENKENEKKKEEKEKSFLANEYKIDLKYKRSIPQGTALIKNARVITMKGKEVIENGDILIENNRIKSVGATGSLSVPQGTREIDAAGKTVIPGFIDTHAHMRPNHDVHKNQVWIFSANLAYGVTTIRDPQTGTTDILTYSDMIEEGMMHGPRVYSTGPGVGFWGYKLKDLEHTKKVLSQYSEYYNTKSIKMYLVGNRQMRQWVIMAAKELKLMPTTEGGLDIKLNMTQMLDGYPGHEHSLPIYPIYKDAIKSIAQSKMAVTPTLLVSYGGPWAEEYYYATEQPFSDPKLQYFTPYEELASKSRRRGAWFMEEEHVFQKHAKFMNDLVREGGLAGIGSHGQLQGLGYHWELWSVQSGGMEPHTALKTATLLGAESLGLDEDLGSIEPGKLADLVILNKNPLEDIRNSNSVKFVIKNGVIYDAGTLDEIHPENKKATPFLWQTKKPENLPGLKM
ncbi:MAG TPA: amidohydrolase family protein [Gillisia sp.]|nr:amidohydrolase family protein [Gillisia sp.]